jgi:hypothetical protein
MRTYALNLLATRGASLDTFVATGARCVSLLRDDLCFAWSDPPAPPPPPALQL